MKIPLHLQPEVQQRQNQENALLALCPDLVPRPTFCGEQPWVGKAGHLSQILSWPPVSEEWVQGPVSRLGPEAWMSRSRRLHRELTDLCPVCSVEHLSTQCGSQGQPAGYGHWHAVLPMSAESR